MEINAVVQYSEEVRIAKQEKRPIVALESTIISHGMPHPENLKTAIEVEDIVRKEGAVPATIAIIEGKICVGVTREQLRFLATSNEIQKVSRRDLPYVLTIRGHGATTVAATMICAKLADIQVFATGGIGGVHREGHNTLDVSADLQELARTDVAVVCAGAKSILDIGLTLEYLETHGVPVVGYRTDAFPGFYTRETTFSVDYRMDDPSDIAELARTKWALGIRGGIVVANPVPTTHALAGDEIDTVIHAALEEGNKKKIEGKAITPFLLDHIKQKTSGRSLQTNIALVKDNAKLASKMARFFSK